MKSIRGSLTCLPHIFVNLLQEFKRQLAGLYIQVIGYATTETIGIIFLQILSVENGIVYCRHKAALNPCIPR